MEHRIPRPPETIPLLTAHDIAKLLNLTSARAVYAMNARGEIPGVIRIGRRLRFDANEVHSWLRKLRVLSM